MNPFPKDKYEMLFSVGAEAQILLDHLIKVFSQQL